MLNGSYIKTWHEQGYIHISDPKPKHFGPNSYDVRLSATLKTYFIPPTEEGIALEKVADDENSSIKMKIVPANNEEKEQDCKPLDCRKVNKTYEFEIPEEGFVLYPGMLYLGSTMEEIGSDYCVPMYEGRSSAARLGIQSHISAGFGDVGFKSRWTLEITVIHPVRVCPGMRIGQVYFNTLFIVKPPNVSYLNEIKKAIQEGWIKLYSGKYVNQSNPQESRLHQDFKN